MAIDLDVTSNSPDGDIKLELFGDGESFDPDKGSYDSTGYVLIFGGWHNSLSVICRQEEHGAGRKAQRADLRVEPGRRYHFAITRRQGAIDWQIDGRPFLAWTDPEPLSGPAHAYFAVDDWEADVALRQPPHPAGAVGREWESRRKPRVSIWGSRWPPWPGARARSSTCTTTPTRTPWRRPWGWGGSSSASWAPRSPWGTAGSSGGPKTARWSRRWASASRPSTP